MRFTCSRFLVAAGAAILLLWAHSGAVAQTADAKPNPPAQKAEGDTPKKADEFAEAAKVLGGPASNPECVWLGKRAVSLLYNDDLDTAFRHLELYDRFGCPSGHIQATFRCTIRQGKLDPKVENALNNRVQGCWLNPTGEGPAPTSAAVPSTTTSR
jgi:hypothetical protein